MVLWIFTINDAKNGKQKIFTLEAFRHRLRDNILRTWYWVQDFDDLRNLTWTH